MISRKSTFFLGIFIFLIPFLGLPSFWKTLMIALSGIFLVFLSVKIVLPRKMAKGRARVKKEKVTPVFVENIPVYPKDNTMETANINIKPSRSSKTDIK